MSQIFHRSWNVIVRVGLLGVILALIALGVIAMTVQRSSYVTGVGVMHEQPVPFSHQHHAGELGIDCRFCHQSVEKSAFAGMPSTFVCMKCHSQVWPRESMLEPVRASYREGEPIAWARVHDLPDYSYFNHSIHVAKGIACATCHGQVDRMPLMAAANPMQMRWCLACHREPEKFVRPREAVFDMQWRPPTDRLERMALGEKLVEAHGIVTEGLTNCTVCHR